MSENILRSNLIKIILNIWNVDKSYNEDNIILPFAFNILLKTYERIYLIEIFSVVFIKDVS